LLTGEEDVARDIQRGRHGQGLVDGLDAHRARVLGVAEMHRLAVDHDLAGVGAHRAGKALDEGGLARAIVADHREHLAGVELQVDAGESDNVAEQLDEVARFEDRPGHDFTLRIHWSAATATITRMPTAST
jgi:hypothetical protein